MITSVIIRIQKSIKYYLETIFFLFLIKIIISRERGYFILLTSFIDAMNNKVKMYHGNIDNKSLVSCFMNTVKTINFQTVPICIQIYLLNKSTSKI